VTAASWIDGANVVGVAAAKRGLSMVFQSYALYPHMSVRGNIGFGLKMAGLPRDEISRKVEAAAATLNLTAYLDRKPRELSGGQRQRVADLGGRSFASRKPSCSTSRCPISMLALRVQMRLEITTLQKQLATTRRLCHARPGRGHDDGRPDRGAQCRPHRAVRLAARTLRPARQSFLSRASSARRA